MEIADSIIYNIFSLKKFIMIIEFEKYFLNFII